MVGIQRRKVLKGVGTTGLALSGAASYYAADGLLSERSSSKQEQENAWKPPTADFIQEHFSPGKNRVTAGLPAGEPRLEHSFGKVFNQFYTDGNLYIGVTDDEVRFSTVRNPADHRTGALSAGRIKRSGLFQGSPVFHIKDGIYRFDTETESLSRIISEVGEPAGLAITDRAFVVADEHTVWVKEGGSNPRELDSESVVGDTTIVPDSLCIAESGQIYFADATGRIWQTSIDTFAQPKSVSVELVAETGAVTAMSAVGNQLVYTSATGVGVITVDSETADEAAVGSSVHPATNGTDIITAHDQTVAHLTLDEELTVAAEYEVPDSVEHIQLAGRNAAITTTNGTTIIDLSTDTKSTRQGQIRYIDPNYTIYSQNGRTHLTVNA